MSYNMGNTKTDRMVYSLFQAVHSRDNYLEVLHLLKSEEFEALSEEQKVHVLREREPENIDECMALKNPPSEEVVDSNNDGLLAFIMRLDRLRCLETVLQFLPLYSVYKREGNTHNTDGGGKDAREILHEHKAVWEVTEAASEEDGKANQRKDIRKTREENAEACKNSGTAEKTKQPDTLWSLKRYAFATLAAELFISGYNYNASRCTQFLLKQAPGLVHIKVQGKLPLASALMSAEYNCKALLLLVKHESGIGAMDACAELAKLYTRGHVNATPCKSCSKDTRVNRFVCNEWELKTKMIIDRNEALVKNYRDRDGNTLLHVLTAQFSTQQPSKLHYEAIYECFQKLLASGIDPTCGNSTGQSVLHILMRTILSPAGHPDNRMPALLRCVELLAPLFKGMKMKDEELLENLFTVCAYQQSVHIYKRWINIYKLIFEHHVMDAEFVVSSGLTPWQLVLRGGEMYVNPDAPCLLHKPLSELCNLALERGCDVVGYIEATSGTEVPNRTGLIYKHNAEIRKFLVWQHGGLPTNYCCYLSLLKLLMENRVDITRLVMPSVPNAYALVFNEMISDSEWDCKRNMYMGKLIQLLSLEEMYSICKTLLIHFPRCSKSLLSSLLLSISEHTKDRAKEMIKDLLLLQCSLKFLSKRAILRSMQHKRQAEKLPLPTRLKTYIMEG